MQENHGATFNLAGEYTLHKAADNANSLIEKSWSASQVDTSTVSDPRQLRRIDRLTTVDKIINCDTLSIVWHHFRKIHYLFILTMSLQTVFFLSPQFPIILLSLYNYQSIIAQTADDPFKHRDQRINTRFYTTGEWQTTN